MIGRTNAVSSTSKSIEINPVDASGYSFSSGSRTTLLRLIASENTTINILTTFDDDESINLNLKGYKPDDYSYGNCYYYSSSASECKQIMENMGLNSLPDGTYLCSLSTIKLSGSRYYVPLNASDMEFTVSNKSITSVSSSAGYKISSFSTTADKIIVVFLSKQ